MMEGRLWQVSKLFEKDDAIATSSFRRLCYKSLSWILSHMVLKISNFIWQQKGVRHEFIV